MINYAQAMRAIQDGQKVKLPDWGGYWYKDGDKIMVLTKDGDVLDTPWHEKYQHRDDWQITDGRLGFDFAIRALKNGKRVAREGWNGKSMWLRIPGPYIVKNGNGVDSIHTSMSFIEMRTAQGQFVPWLASQTDMLAEDWQLVD